MGVDGVAGHGQFERHGHRESFGQPQEAAGAGDQTPLRLGDAEHGVLRRHHQVAGEHDLEPTGQGGAVDGGDDRLGEAPLREPAESTAGPHDVAALAAGEGLEVHAGAEGLVAAPGDDHHPAFVVVGQLVHGRRHGPAHRAVDGVARLGTVDGEDLDVPPALPQHFVSHGCSLHGPSRQPPPPSDPSLPVGAWACQPRGGMDPRCQAVCRA